MLFQFLAMSALLSTSLALPASEQAAASASPECHKYVLISTRGTFELQGPSPAFKGMIKSTLDTVAGGIEYDTKYAAGPDLTYTTGRDGAADIERYITNGLAQCPDQKYALLGFSQGALVTVTAITNMANNNKAALDAVDAIVLEGNALQIKDQPNTVDETGGDSTRGHNGAALPLASIFGADPKSVPQDKLLNICYTADPACNGLAYSLTTVAHYGYAVDSRAQEQGAKFLISKLQ